MRRIVLLVALATTIGCSSGGASSAPPAAANLEPIQAQLRMANDRLETVSVQLDAVTTKLVALETRLAAMCEEMAEDSAGRALSDEVDAIEAADRRVSGEAQREADTWMWRGKRAPAA